MPNCSGCGEWLSLYDGLALAHSQNQCVSNLRRRIEQIESKLGAASVIGSKAQASEATARRQEAGAAPSVSGYIRWGTEHQQDDILAADRLAAAVTEWWEDPKGTPALKHEQIELIVSAFVRGEPLPSK